MRRRQFLGHSMFAGGLALSGSRVSAEPSGEALNSAAEILEEAARSNEIESSSLYVRRGDMVFSKAFGGARDTDAIFLLASISKTIAVAAVMTLYDEGEFRLDDRVRKYLPDFRGGGREQITIRQLMTHVSGLPDQLPENARLRASHSPLSRFVDAAIKTPLVFQPGTRYGYSSMAILLVTEIARRISGVDIHDLADQRIYRPLKMDRSAMGLGKFDLSEVVLNQVERAAPESGAGDPSTKSWDWNSPYWRNMGAPWGAAHGSAEDVGRFLSEFLYPTGAILKPATCELMVRNHNAADIRRRGLGFDLGQIGGTPRLSRRTFGHTGSTGTICWADPATDSVCVILTTLPYRAVTPHPRDAVAAKVAEAF